MSDDVMGQLCFSFFNSAPPTPPWSGSTMEFVEQQSCLACRRAPAPETQVFMRNVYYAPNLWAHMSLSSFSPSLFSFFSTQQSRAAVWSAALPPPTSPPGSEGGLPRGSPTTPYGSNDDRQGMLGARAGATSAVVRPPPHGHCPRSRHHLPPPHRGKMAQPRSAKPLQGHGDASPIRRAAGGAGRCGLDPASRCKSRMVRP
jgi:hypothetical protein